MHIKNIIKTIPLLLILAGCAQLPPDTNERLGQFTVVSSFNVGNLEHEEVKNMASHTKGKACYQVDVNTLAYISGTKDNLMQRAMDNAIRNAQGAGIDGDLLVNARIEHITEYKEKDSVFKSTQRYECVVVEGDLVKIKK